MQLPDIRPMLFKMTEEEQSEFITSYILKRKEDLESVLVKVKTKSSPSSSSALSPSSSSASSKTKSKSSSPKAKKDNDVIKLTPEQFKLLRDLGIC